MSSDIDIPEHILLIQARPAGDEMLVQEQTCFAKRLGCPVDHLETQNLVEDPFDDGELDRFELCLVGGSGDYSLVDLDADWKRSLVDAMETIATRNLPMFGSCFGFQALVRASGGQLEAIEEQSELGTFEIQLTENGKDDELFGQLPERFNAQLGHNDSVSELPDSLIRLAVSDRCSVQAIRHKSAPIVATQFHPELTHHENMERFKQYIHNYKKPGETLEDAEQRAIDIHAPSPESNRLLTRFIETEL